MSAASFINEFDRVIRSLSPTEGAVLRHREASCVNAILACRSGSRSDATAALEPYFKRQVTEDADWIYDDFLLFSFLCVLGRFGENRELVTKLVSFRRRAEQGVQFKFLQDAERLADCQEFSAKTMFSVVIADILEEAMESPEDLRSAHREAVQRMQDDRISVFERVIAARCQEIVAELSVNSSMSSSIVARNLWSRAHFASMVAYLSLITPTTCIIAWIVWVSFVGEKELSSWAGKFISVGAVGIVIYIWKSKSEWYRRIAYSLVWLVSGRSGYRAMRALRNRETGLTRDH